MRCLLAKSGSSSPVNSERVVLRLKSDSSGDIYLPTGGYSFTGSRSCPYSWNISIDGGTNTEYTGTGSTSNNIRVGYGLKPGTVHTVTITPVTEEYGWCRALCFNGSSYAPTLINIISDKTYMGFAKNAEDTGDYFKYYQYAGCTNLKDTDAEYLPDTVKYIGDNYRAYEYYGCSSLGMNATENINKTVVRIGTNFRTCQYMNCSGLETIRIRALNRASTGTGYRSSMLSGAGNANTVIYIEGGIVEGGSWGLSDAKVKNIKVYSGLVTDYQTMLSGITSSKIVNNPDLDTNNYEYIEFTIKADASGYVNVPIAGYSTSGTQNCEYDWEIQMDGVHVAHQGGYGSASYIPVATATPGSEHKIVIMPYDEVYWGWARAFGFKDSGIANLVTSFTHDSYKGFATSYTETGDYFKYSTFYGCTNLTNVYEKLPTSVTTIGADYYGYCYKGCSSIEEAQCEVMHPVTAIGSGFRAYEFDGCSSLILYPGLYAKPSTVAEYDTFYRSYMFSGVANNFKVYMWNYEELYSGTSNSMGLTNSIDGVYCFVGDMALYTMNSNWSDLSANKFKASYYDYDVVPTRDISKYTKFIGEFTVPTIGWDSSRNQYYYPGVWNTSERGVCMVSEGSYDVRISGDSARNNGAMGAMLSKISWKEGESVATNIRGGEIISWGTISGSGPYDGNIHSAFTDRLGNVIYSYGSNQSVGGGGYQSFKSRSGRGYISENGDWGSWVTATSASKCGRWVYYNQKRYFSPTRFGGDATTEVGGYSPVYTDIDFSDDGYTAYLSTGYGNITQYNLTNPWDITTGISSTGKTKAISGNWCFSYDRRYLFQWNGKLTVYEYEE